MPLALMWFRRDLRLYDNAALHHALRAAHAAGGRCVPLFVFDREILDHLHDRPDRRVDFIWQSVAALQAELARHGAELVVRYGRAREVLAEVVSALAPLGLVSVHANHDYEPRRLERDAAVRSHCAALGVGFHTYKDHVVFETDEVLTRQGTPHRVYTPYKNAWYARLAEREAFYLKAYPTLEKYAGSLLKAGPQYAPDAEIHAALARLSAPAPTSLADMGFGPSDLRLAGGTPAARGLLDDFLARINRYGELRDYPGRKGVSYLSVHLRFGTLSIRELFRLARARGSAGARKWADELVWREFYNAILHHFPHTERQAFRPEFESVAWDDPRADPVARGRFEAWCTGQTGYPIVDAAMRQLNTTGYMHNRLRMIVASFLTKDLHVHWKHGERYFARKLLDYDLSQNLGGWQWAASTGADGQPYFRIFNPVSQGETWDPDGAFVTRYCPELKGFAPTMVHHPWDASLLDQADAKCRIGTDYPLRIVDHGREREEALARFKAASQKGLGEMHEV